MWVFYGDLYSTKFIARSSGGQKSKTWCQPPELLDKDPLSDSYHYLWGLEFHHMNFGGTHIFRPWHWCTWRDWGKSWKCVSSWTSGLALITQKQMLALGSLEDPRLWVFMPRTLLNLLSKAICGPFVSLLCLISVVLLAFYW